MKGILCVLASPFSARVHVFRKCKSTDEIVCIVCHVSRKYKSTDEIISIVWHTKKMLNSLAVLNAGHYGCFLIRRDRNAARSISRRHRQSCSSLIDRPIDNRRVRSFYAWGRHGGCVPAFQPRSTRGYSNSGNFQHLNCSWVSQELRPFYHSSLY